MRKLRIFLLIATCAVIYGCPFESTVPLAASPAEPVDTSLFGYWYGIVKDGSDFFGIEALEIDKQPDNDSIYSIIRYGKAIKGDIILPDTSYFTGYVSYIGGQRFMNVEGTVLITSYNRKKGTVVEAHKVFYLSNILRSNDTLSVKTITEQFSPSRQRFTSPAMLKEEVKSLLQSKENIYDDIYSMSYRKIEKPKPLKGF